MSNIREVLLRFFFQVALFAGEDVFNQTNEEDSREFESFAAMYGHKLYAISVIAYQGGYTQVKEAVRKIRRVKREVFMPLIHRPGEAQVDFGFALAKIAGVSFQRP